MLSRSYVHHYTCIGIINKQTKHNKKIPSTITTISHQTHAHHQHVNTLLIYLPIQKSNTKHLFRDYLAVSLVPQQLKHIIKQI